MKKTIRLTENDLHKIINESVKRIVKEGYYKENQLQRVAYDNQTMRPKIREVAKFADEVANIGKQCGKDDYYRFYSHLASDIFQMDNLWNFLDFDED